jgi:hypothetical protein
MDFGITYLRLNTDQQQHAYVLKKGETDAPAYLKTALANGNRLQDIFINNFKLGRTGNEVLSMSRQQAIAEGIKPSIYTHPIGFHGHAAGTTLGMWDSQDGVPGEGDILSMQTRLIPSSSTLRRLFHSGTKKFALCWKKKLILSKVV